jgi:hypothetical protein
LLPVRRSPLPLPVLSPLTFLPPLPAIADITSVSSATALGASNTAAAGRSFSPPSAFKFPFLGTAGDWGVMAGVAVIGGMVGAVAVL